MQIFFETPQFEHYILNYIDIIHDELILVNNNYSKIVEESNIPTQLNILINNMGIPNNKLIEKSIDNNFIDLGKYILYYLFSENSIEKLYIRETFELAYEKKNIEIIGSLWNIVTKSVHLLIYM